MITKQVLNAKLLWSNLKNLPNFEFNRVAKDIKFQHNRFAQA